MAKKSNNPEADRLKQLLQDASSTTAQVDMLESELTEAQHGLSEAVSLEESDAIRARVEELKAALQQARDRADIAAGILARDGATLEEAALRTAARLAGDRYTPKAKEVDAAIVATTAQLFDLFGQRRELESECHNTIVESVPDRPGSLGLSRGTINGVPCVVNHISEFVRTLQRVEQVFS